MYISIEWLRSIDPYHSMSMHSKLSLSCKFISWPSCLAIYALHPPAPPTLFSNNLRSFASKGHFLAEFCLVLNLLRQYQDYLLSFEQQSGGVLLQQGRFKRRIQ
ncbi:hypothetical protein V6N11_053296 [Hibiscus sabdariffa]|uniref:Uncharacterized protein n=1 Tax=Hibiscus sabdariffa TaxID=183260 RepID=A0ABR2UDA1_9ROSI